MILHSFYVAACELQAEIAQRSSSRDNDGNCGAAQQPGHSASSDVLRGEFAIVSVETAKQGGIAEIAALRIGSGMAPVAEFHVPVNAESEMKDALLQLAAFVNQQPLFVYDAHVARQWLQRAAGQHGLRFENVLHDGLLLVWSAWPGLPSYQLAELAGLLGLECQAKQRALATAHTTLALLRAASQSTGSASPQPDAHVHAGLAGENAAQSG